MKRIVALFGSLALLGLAETAAATGCQGPVSVSHLTGGNPPEGGGFDFSGTGYIGRSDAPPVRFWAHGAYAKANSGSQPQTNENNKWLINPSTEWKLKGVSPAVYVLLGADWFGNQVEGCPLRLSEAGEAGAKAAAVPRTVVELSFPDPAKEGTTAHNGQYLVVSIPLRGGVFDADLVRGGSGGKGNVIPVSPIPAPVISGAPKPLGSSHVALAIDLPAAASFSEGGKDAPALVKGYRVLYAEGSEPTSSDPAKYQVARDAKATDKELGVVKPGTTTVAVPAGKSIWLVAQLVYDDPGALYSRATSAHVAVGAGEGKPPAASGRKRSGADRH